MSASLVRCIFTRMPMPMASPMMPPMMPPIVTGPRNASSNSMINHPNKAKTTGIDTINCHHLSFFILTSLSAVCNKFSDCQSLAET